MNKTNKNLFIDPSYSVFLKNRLFDLNDKILNRDDQLLPFVRLKQNLLNKNINLKTADYFFETV